MESFWREEGIYSGKDLWKSWERKREGVMDDDAFISIVVPSKVP